MSFGTFSPTFFFSFFSWGMVVVVVGAGFTETKDTYEIACTLFQVPDKWKTHVWYKRAFKNRALIFRDTDSH